jgi:EAL domain-containing protein (putative c-di-GMP-specific phosphodiesterase class I)
VFEHCLYVSPSIGAALYPQDGQDATTLLKHADVAMYDAKSAGRNRYAFYQAEMNASAADTLGLEMDLREAVARRALFLEYQPQIDLLTGRCTGVEALLRWEHPQRGRVPPDRFIGLLEDMGHIGAVTTEVLADACGDVARLNARFGLRLQLAVNLSNAQFRAPTLVEQIAAALDRCGLPPALLELEMTESTLMQDLPATQQALQALRMLGVRLAVDDFGTGYSSLAYLRRFSADTIKIDRSFVRDACDDAGARTIVKAIVSLGRDLNMQVVAEGVETPAQLALLRGLACERAQGYLFSPPVSIAALEGLIARSGAGTGRYATLDTL